MTRIFTTLAFINGLLLIACFIAGAISKLGDALHNADDPTFMVHFWLGLLSTISSLLVHCLVFIYLLGTGRWVKEVGIAYELPDAPLPKLTRELKRKTFPPALFAMLAPIAASAAGAGVQTSEWPWLVHGSLACIALLINFWAYSVEFRNIRANAAVIENVIMEVDRIRSERGLPSNAEALQQEESR